MFGNKNNESSEFAKTPVFASVNLILLFMFMDSIKDNRTEIFVL